MTPQDAPLLRSLLPVKLSSLALSHSCAYIAGGTAEGRLFVWETATGSLLAAFDGHFRSIGVLAWIDDDAAFITGSDDATTKVWSLARCAQS